MIGLSSEEALVRLKKVGPNTIPEKETGFLFRISKKILSPDSLDIRGNYYSGDRFKKIDGS